MTVQHDSKISWWCDSCEKARIDDLKSQRNHLASCGHKYLNTHITSEGLRPQLENIKRELRWAKKAKDADALLAKKAAEEAKQHWFERFKIKGKVYVDTPKYLVNDAAILHRSNSPNFRLDKATVSGFTSLVYSLYVPNKNHKHMTFGKTTENNIENYWNDRENRLSSKGEWRLIHRDSNSARSFPIESLRINGRPLLGKPDLVYVNELMDTVMIIERKCTFSNRGIPSDGWPNLRAQLWAYSKIDYFKKYSKMILVGEIWKASQVKGRAMQGIPHIIKFESSALDEVWPIVFERAGGEITFN